MILNKKSFNLQKDLASLKFPKIPNDYNKAHEYFLSKCEDNLVKKYPEWDIIRPCPTIEIINAEKDLNETEIKLQRKVEEQKIYREKLDSRWAELRKKQESFRENFIQFDKFVQENYEKRLRAEKKLVDDKEMIEKRELDIKDIKQHLENMKNAYDKMLNYIKKYNVYEEYLNQVVIRLNLANFQTPQDILNRYDALVSAKKELADQQTNDLEALELARSEFVKLTDEKSYAILGLHNNLAELHARYETAKSRSLHWEFAVTKILNISSINKMNLEFAKKGIWNLYTQMCERKNVPITIKKDNLEGQLNFIKKILIELNEVTKAAKTIASSKEYKNEILPNFSGDKTPNVDVIKIIR